MSQLKEQIETLNGLSVSALSTFYQFDCEKLLKQVSDKDYGRKKYFGKKNNHLLKNENENSTSLREASKNRGIEFELAIKEKLENVVDCSDIDPSEAKNILRTAKIGQILYQLRFEVPNEFYDELNIRNSLKLQTFIPDFIQIIEEDNERKLFIIDAKASKSSRISHQFQVASYAYLTSFIIRKIRNLSVSRIGGIYLPHFESFQLHTFRADFLFPKIEWLFRNELPRIMTSTDVQWHYNARCKSCDFVNKCREDAEGSIAMIPYMSVDNAEYLKEAIRYWKTNNLNDDGEHESSSNKNNVDIDVDIEDLSNYFQKISIDEKNSNSQNNINHAIKKIIKYNRITKASPYLKAIETKQAQYLGIATPSFPQITDHNLIISMSLDPFLSRSFGWAICIYTSDGKPIQSYRHADIISKDDAFGRKFVDLMEKFVTKLAKCFEYLAKEKSRACIFVYSEQEKNTIKDSLLKILSMDSNLVPSSVGHLAARCLFNLFEDSSLLLASRNSEINEIPELSGESSEFLRVIILEQAIRENIAIHVPGFYRLIDVWEQMVRPKLEDEQLLELLNEQAKNIDLEEIYSSWISSKCEEVIGLNKAHLLRNDFANAVIKVYYMLLKEYTDDISSKLLFAPSPFKFAEIRSFKNDYLGKIYFFKQYEAITESKQVRSGRFADYVSDEAKNGILLQLDKFINKSGSEWVMRFDVLSDGKVGSLLEKSNLKEFILVEDTMKGILEAIKFPDMKYRNTIFGFAFTVVSIHDIDYSNPDKKIINLKGYIKKSLNVGSKYRLYKRYVDFNLDKVLKVLSEIDECEESIFLQLLKDPNAWGAKKLICEDEDLKDIKKMALELRDSFLMSPSQKEFSASLLERRLQIVWGPPGSGKTHFLALFINWYLSTIKPKPTGKNKNFIIGITAFTRVAIDNLLKRVAKVQNDLNKMCNFDIIRLINKSNEQPPSDMFECQAGKLFTNISKNKIGSSGRPIVVGGTVWDWLKVKKGFNNSWSGCDIFVIDEGSQLLASDASIVVECLNYDNGRLIVAGDHMQLGPIIQNTYPVFPDDHPLVFESVQKCLMRKEDGSVFKVEDFFLKKGQKHNFGPCTIQLQENWRMNDELNSFFQRIYGDKYLSVYPNLKLTYLDSSLPHITDPKVRQVLSLNPAITLVKLTLTKDEEKKEKDTHPFTESMSRRLLKAEAQVVYEIVSAYFNVSRKQEKKYPSLIVVTPHHRQRHAIQSRLSTYLQDPDIILQVNTVEKMQGQESDIVIACFGFLDVNEISKETDFLFDCNRWNVAISRAKCKVVVITTDEMLYPQSLEVFSNKKTSEGWVFLRMIEKWVQEKSLELNKEKKNGGLIEWNIDNDEVVVEEDETEEAKEMVAKAEVVVEEDSDNIYLNLGSSSFDDDQK
ncbi:8372_t:CDS:10, partial [Entrophospora sp. SA101]